MNEKPKLNEFCWNELATSNVQAAKDFYGKVFGWQFSDHEMSDMTYTMIKAGNNEFAGIWPIPKDQQNQIPAHWMSYILVENVDEALSKAQSAGANVIKPAATVGDFGRFAIITDPTGAHIAMWQTLKKS